jgi:hypothetical protein
MSDNPIVKAVEDAKIVVFSPRAESGKDAKKKRKSSSRGKGGGGDPPAPPPPEEPGADDGDELSNDMNTEFSLVLVGSKAIIMREQPAAPAHDRLRMLTCEAFNIFMQNRRSSVTSWQKDDNGEWKPVTRVRLHGPYWLKSPNRRTYNGLEFVPDPGAPPETPGYFNLWRGFSVTPDPEPPTPRQRGPADRSAKYFKFYDHLRGAICGGADVLFNWLWHWFAHLIQRPRERIGTAVVLRGGMGVGKTVVGDVIGSLFPANYFLVDNSRYLTGQFNAHMASCLLLQCDEATWGGNKESEGRLKGLITADKQMIEAKGVDPIMIANYVRVLLTSNEAWVVPTGMDERRWAILDVLDLVLEGERKAHYRALYDELANGGRAALLADLLEVDLDAADAPNLRVIPKTKGLLEQKIHSLEPVPSWWLGRLADGSQTHRAQSWRDKIPIRTLHRDFLRTSEDLGVRRKSSETQFAMHMHKLCPSLIKVKSTEKVDETDDMGRETEVYKRVNCWKFPSLELARAEFDGALRQPFDWGEDPEETDNGDREGDCYD